MTAGPRLRGRPTIAHGFRGAARKDARAGLWERLDAHLESIPESEYERLRRVGVRRGHSVDTTHPPTHLRRACLLAGDPVAAEVVTDAAAHSAIGAELAEARERLARQVVQGG